MQSGSSRYLREPEDELVPEIAVLVEAMGSHSIPALRRPARPRASSPPSTMASLPSASLPLPDGRIEPPAIAALYCKEPATGFLSHSLLLGARHRLPQPLMATTSSPAPLPTSPAEAWPPVMLGRPRHGRRGRSSPACFCRTKQSFCPTAAGSVPTPPSRLTLIRPSTASGAPLGYK
jgi:hypothetical protein